MNRILFSRKLTAKDHFKILRSLLIFINATTLFLYLFLRILFFNTPITLSDDLVALFKTIMIGSFAAIGISCILLLIEIADHIIIQKKLSLHHALKYTGITLFSLLIFYLAA